MRHFAIRREVHPGATWGDVDAAAIQTLAHLGLAAAAVLMEPRILDVSWVRTYWDQSSGWATCLFTGRDASQVLKWHEICAVPFAEIREIEVLEAAGIDYPRGFHVHVGEEPLVAVETRAEGGRAEPGAGWIRTYRDGRSGHELQLFRADRRSRRAGATARRVVEYGPSDYQ